MRLYHVYTTLDKVLFSVSILYFFLNIYCSIHVYQNSLVKEIYLESFRGLYELSGLTAISAKEDNFCGFKFALLHVKPLLKKVSGGSENILTLF